MVKPKRRSVARASRVSLSRSVALQPPHSPDPSRSKLSLSTPLTCGSRRRRLKPMAVRAVLKSSLRAWPTGDEMTTSKREWGGLLWKMTLTPGSCSATAPVGTREDCGIVGSLLESKSSSPTSSRADYATPVPTLSQCYRNVTTMLTNREDCAQPRRPRHAGLVLEVDFVRRPNAILTVTRADVCSSGCPTSPRSSIRAPVRARRSDPPDRPLPRDSRPSTERQPVCQWPPPEGPPAATCPCAPLWLYYAAAPDLGVQCAPQEGSGANVRRSCGHHAGAAGGVGRDAAVLRAGVGQSFEPVRPRPSRRSGCRPCPRHRRRHLRVYPRRGRLHRLR